MSAFCGVFLKHASAELRDGFVNGLADALRFYGSDQYVSRIDAAHATLFKFDFDAFGSRGVAEDANAIGVVAGHPHFDGVSSHGRDHHAALLVDASANQNFSRIASTRGSFSFAVVYKQEAALILGTDCLGVRPVYFYEDRDKVIFSTTIGLLERSHLVPLVQDFRGAVENGIFQFCTDERTVYRDIKCIRGGTVKVLSRDSSVTHQYWSWPSVQPDNIPESELLGEVFTAFNDAIDVRLSGESRVMAFLTGGLDSRSVAAALKRRNVLLNTCNFAPPKSQDLVYGAKLGAALGTDHFELPMTEGSVADRVGVVMSKWIEWTKQRQCAAERPRIVWSGDGGSVGLGHVYISRNMVGLYEKGQIDEALHALLRENTWAVPTKLLRRELRDVAGGMLFEGMRDELRRLNLSGTGRDLHLLIMVTDQRRHLNSHYEGIFAHRCELQLPFFDRKFLQTVLSRPIEPFLEHRFYNQWIRLFGDEAVSVPWQVYPGHEAGHLQRDENLDYQWAANKNDKQTRIRIRQLAVQTLVRSLLGTDRAPSVSSVRLFAVALAVLAGKHEYHYALQFAASLVRNSTRQRM